VPAPMSATLRVGELIGMLGCTRKPKVLVVTICCSSSLLETFSLNILLKGAWNLPFWYLFESICVYTEIL
jgi:hypothetical protein